MIWAEFSLGLWLLHTALGGGLIVLVAWIWLRFVRQPARQQRLGEMGMAAALLVAILSLAPAWVIFSVPARPSPNVEDSLAAAESKQFPFDVPSNDSLTFALVPEETTAVSVPVSLRPAPAVGSSNPGEPAPGAVPWLSLLGIAYGMGAAFILCRWWIGYIGLWHLVRRAEAAPPRVARLFATMSAGPRRPRLLVARRLRVPISCGLLRPTIVLPAELCDAPASELRWIFAHELTHLERRDPWTCLLFAVGQAVFFYLPWFWLLRRQVRLCQEYVADAAAAAGEQPANYAQFLLNLTTAPAAPACATGVSGHTSDLFRRIAMLLQTPCAVERRCPRLWSLATAGGLLSIAVLIAGIGLRANAATPGDDRVAVNSPDDTKKDDPKKEQPKKDDQKKDDKDQPKKEKKRIIGGDFELPDLEEILKNLPQNLDPEKLAEIRKQLEQVRGEMRKRLEEMRRNMPEGMPGRFPFRGMRAMIAGSGRLGIRVDRPSSVLADQLDLPKGQGLVVQDVLPDSAAAKAGLKPHDVLLQFDGKAVSNDPAEFSELVREAKADTPLSVVVKRKGKEETIKGLSLPEQKIDPRTRRRAPSIREVLPPLPPKTEVPFQGGFSGEVL
jgi:beta-lactamase regulating signal transducer with metallopeptidase domain